MSEPDFKVFFSIDFGTYGFFVCFAHPGNCTNAIPVQNFSRTNVNYEKILNALLISKSTKEVLAYGFEARDMYVEAKEAKEADDMAYFANFKLQLLQEDDEKEVDFNANKKIKAEDKEFERDLCHLVAQCLGEIKERSLKYYRDNVDKDIQEHEILWVLSVPVCWSEKSREAMRQCCYRIGVAEANVLIVSEPEAAGSYLVWGTEEGAKLKTDDCYMLVDAGSGTYDIVCHKVGEDRRMAEIYHPVGKLRGAVDVDNRFVDLLRQIAGEDAFREFEKNYPQELLLQKMYFQEVREKVRPIHASRKVQLVDMLFEMAEEFNVDIEEKCSDYRLAGSDEACLEVKERSGVFRLEIKRAMWDVLFSDVVDDLRESVEEVLEEVESITKIFLVGGFSQSEFVSGDIERLLGQEKFDDRNIALIQPPRPELATVKGSLWFADQKTICLRRTKVSYGLAVERQTRRGDPEEFRRPDANSCGWKTINVFDFLWEKGDAFQVADTLTKEFRLAPGQRDVEIVVYRSKDEYVKFVDASCREACRWKYELPRENVSVREQTLVVNFEIGEGCLWLYVGVRRDDGSTGVMQKRNMEFKVVWDEADENNNEV